jgi:hypothetical protein
MISIEATNLNSMTLQQALDAVVTVKSGDDAAACVKIMGIDWVPDDVATPTLWTAVIKLNSPDIDNVDIFKDSGCTQAYASATTPLNIISLDTCTGTVTISTDDVDEAVDTLYFSFDWDTEIPDGAEIISPNFAVFAEDHIVRAWHQNSTSGKWEIYEFWRCQIVPNGTIGFDNSNKAISIPVQLEVLADMDFHPDAPLGRIIISDTLPSSLSSLT